ncbi:MAG: hypothetical protein AB7O45_10315 [Alphaproteobacteria bacterium]
MRVRLIGAGLVGWLLATPAYAWDIKTTAVMTNRFASVVTAKMHNEMSRDLNQNETLEHSSYFTSSGNEERVYELIMIDTRNNGNVCRAIVYVQWAFGTVTCRFDGPSASGLSCGGQTTYDAGTKTCRAEMVVQ